MHRLAENSAVYLINQTSLFFFFSDGMTSVIEHKNAVDVANFGFSKAFNNKLRWASSRENDKMWLQYANIKWKQSWMNKWVKQLYIHSSVWNLREAFSGLQQVSALQGYF